jgi:hypothetical protein
VQQQIDEQTETTKDIQKRRMRLGAVPDIATNESDGERGELESSGESEGGVLPCGCFGTVKDLTQEAVEVLHCQSDKLDEHR